MTAALRELVEQASKFGPRELGHSESEAKAWPDSLDLEELAKRKPEAPKFIIDDWLPCGYATLLAGHGGIGKSAIALMLAVCIALGIAFFGLQVTRRRVLLLSCEDRESVLHWRLWRTCRYLGVDLASLRGWLEIVDLVGKDCVLWERDPRTGYTVTSAYSMLEARMRQHQTEVLLVDGISDTYGGNENARTEVKRYVNSLIALIPEDTGAVLLIGHVAKPTAAGTQTTEGYSGSTGWHNSVRARFYLYPETTQGEDGERAQRTGDLILELQKSNMGRVDQSIRFRWDDDAHLFIGTQAAGEMHFDRKRRDREERAGILRAFSGCATSAPPIIIPAAMQGPRTAYHVLSLRPEFPETLRTGSSAIRRFRRQIEELRQLRVINENEYRRTNRHAGSQLVITSEGMRQCAE